MSFHYIFFRVLSVVILLFMGKDEICGQEFTRIYGENRPTFYRNPLYSFIQNAYYVLGDYGNNNSAQGCVSKLDNAGNIIWTVRLSTNSMMELIHEVTDQKSQTSEIIISGSTRDSRDLFVVKLNAATGNIIWQKKYTTNYYFNYPHCVVSKDKIYIVGNTSHGVAIGRLSNEGDVIWSKYIKMNGAGGNFTGFPAVDAAGTIAITYKNSSDVGYFGIDTSGAVKFCYTSSKNNYYFRNIASNGNGFVCTIAQNWYQRQNNHSLVKFDSNGKPEWKKRIYSNKPVNSNCHYGDLYAAPSSKSGNIIYSTIACFDGFSSSHYIILDKDGNLIQAKQSLLDSLTVIYIKALSNGMIGLAGHTQKQAACLGNVTSNSLLSIFNEDGNLCTLRPYNSIIVDDDNVVLTDITNSTSFEPITFTVSNLNLTTTNVTYRQYKFCDDDFKQINLGPDIVSCTSPVTLNAGSGYTSYLWSTGVNSQTINVSSGGTYSVSVTDACGNSFSDTINVRFAPGTTRNQTISICQGDSIVVGDKIYKLPGTYTDTLQTAAGCDSILTTHLNISELQAFSLGNDTTLCHGELLSLGTNVQADNYLWNTGSTASSIDAPAPGIYSLTISNDCGSLSDTIELKATDCDCYVFIPNAFSPNGDGKNDILVIKEENILSSRLIIYNKWGEEVFVTDNNRNSWNGAHRDKQLPPDVYGYYYEGTCLKGNKVEYKGNITIVR